MQPQTDNQMVAMMEQNGSMNMEMTMHSCHTTIYVFGILVILGLVAQVVLQSKMLKQLRKANRK